jgi:tetratricopeptide (TPR) repeat protein
VAGESEFAFRHMLVRDVAYSQIPRRVRAEKHRLAAEWIEGLVDDRDDHVELLADHYLHALELLRAVGDDPGSLAVRARVALREAGERAFRLGAFAAAARLRRQALELWPADDDRPYVLLELAESLEVSEEAGTKEAEEARDLLLALGDFERAALAEAILYAVGPVAEQEAHIEHALALVRDVPDTAIKAAVLSNVAFYWTLRGRIEPALSLAAEVHRIALATGQPDEITNALNALGTARIDNGDLRGVDDLERALTLARESHSPFVAVVAGNLAASLFDLGRLERAFELIAEMRAEATRVGSSQLIEWADVLSMREHYWKGDWDDALRIADARGESANPRVLTVRSQILLARGDADGALEDSARSVQMGRESGHVQMLHSTLAVHTRVCVAVGDMTEARAPFAELLERFAKERSQQVSASLPDLAIAAVDLGLTDEFTQALGALDQAMPWVGAARAFAHQDYAAAADVYGRIGSRPDAAYARLRHAMALGRGAEADRGLQEALVFFRSVGAKRYVGEAENVLAATA